VRTPSAIRRQLEHFRNGCTSDEQTRLAWITTLEWVLADLNLDLEKIKSQPESVTNPYVSLVTAATAAVHALRSYQHGNSSPELAEEIADALDSAIRRAIE